MDVSNHKEKPGQTPVAWLLFRSSKMLLLIFSLLASDASGFTISNLGWGASVQLRPDDIAQDGVPLSAATEQVLDEGMLQADLTDFSIPIDVNLAGALSSSTLTTRINRTYAFYIRLSRAERNRCVQDADFDIDLSIVSPVRGAFAATSGTGGTMRLVRFDPAYRGALGGRRCPNVLFYGYTMDLSVADAVAAGTYEATAEISIDLAGAGGSSQSIQVPLEVQMPGMLLLYHHSQIDVNLDATALAGALGANRACSGGFCMDVGNRSLAVADLSGPVLLNVAAEAGTVDPIQTITLRDAVAVRATGCSGDIYDTASYQVLNPVGGVQPRSGIINGIQSAPCGLDIRSGDLSFDLDLNQVDAVTGSASATIQITVTGL
jgi:hypothetical protein